MRELFIGSDNDITIADVTDGLTGDPIGDATINVVLKDSSGNNVAGSSGTAELIEGTENDYLYTLPSTVSLAENAWYTLHVTPASSGKDILARPKFKAVYYEGEDSAVEE